MKLLPLRLLALTYDAYGNSTGSTRTRYGYTGRERDQLTALLYYRARFYDPQLGRFISEDPLGLAAGLNFFSYVGNNPVLYGDPSGLCPQEPAKPSHSPRSKSDCEAFVDNLVGKVKGYSDAQKLGKDLMYDGVNDYQAGYGKGAPFTGFKGDLTSHGQAGDVYRHVMFVAGSQLLVGGGLTTNNLGEGIARSLMRIGGALDRSGFRVYDWAQSKWGGPQSQYGAEHRGNQAGLEVGNSMLDAYGKGRTADALESLAKALKAALCGN